MINTAYRNDCLGFLFGSTSAARPTKYYVGISTAALNSNGGGIVEPAASTGYKRVEINNTSAFWNTPANGSIGNKLEIRFPEFIADAANAVQFFIATSATATSAIWWDYIYSDAGNKITRPLVQYGTVYINPGDMIINLVNEE